ncbi:MAG: hypothetical protein ACJA1U_000763 [Bermanella sp.]|jgi:hypothetical protein
MSKRLVALSLCSAVLVGCGSGDSSGAEGSFSEYSLSEYEGRSVNTETLAGTWVAVGTGVENFPGVDGGRGDKRYAVKEYFVISQSEDGYTKSGCEQYSSNDISLSDGVIEFEDFKGNVTDNKIISGSVFKEDRGEAETADSYYSTETVSIQAIKISDNTDSFAQLAFNVGEGEETLDLLCYQQSNGYIDYKNYDLSFVSVDTYPSQMFQYKGDIPSAFLYVSKDFSDYEFDSDDAGNSIVFDINADSEFSEIVTFNASDNSDSITGTVSITLPQ